MSSSSEAVGRQGLTERQQQNIERLYKMEFAKVYSALLAKTEGKGRTRAELDQAICWLTGHTPTSLAAELEGGTLFKPFFDQAPHLNPARNQITGMVCGVRIEEVEDPTMRTARQLDKLVDELAKGKAMEKVLRA